MRSLRRRLPIRWATTAPCRNGGQTAAAVRPLKARQGFATARTAPLPRAVRTLLYRQAEVCIVERPRLTTKIMCGELACPLATLREHSRRPGASLWPPHSPHYGWNYTIRAVRCQHGIEHGGGTRVRGALFAIFRRILCAYRGEMGRFSVVLVVCLALKRHMRVVW